MPALSQFEDILENRLAALIQGYLTGLGCLTEVFPGESKETDVNPRVVVSTTTSEESVYQTGIYEVSIEVTVKVNLDAERSNDLTNPDSCQALYAAVLDVLQKPDLPDLLGASSQIAVKGIVLGSARLAEIIERQWVKIQTVNFFGYSM